MRLAVRTVSVLAILTLAGPCAYAAQVDLVGPPGSSSFGYSVTVLPNGHLVITDPDYDSPGPIADVGAVYLYHGLTLQPLSVLTGSTAGDRVGSGGVTVLGSGDFVIMSPHWDNGTATNAGAVTWASASVGAAGLVTMMNSLVGGGLEDRVGSGGVLVLASGNFVVRSPDWDNGAAVNAGAVTWGSAVGGITGVVAAANSLVGGKSEDRVGFEVIVLTNGHYVVSSPDWDHGTLIDAGAVTWGDGRVGVTGLISLIDSLVGTSAHDRIGSEGVWPVANANYVVASPNWDDGAAMNAGAVTWGDGAAGVRGTIAATNSLVGDSANDGTGFGLAVLANGNYVVRSPNWMNGASASAGAVTWASGMTGVTGLVTAANSLVGATTGDRVGSGRFSVLTGYRLGIQPLAQGDYVVFSPYWDNGLAVNAGAATWGSGVMGVTGVVSTANSLVGSSNDDAVGIGGVLALANGNYAVVSSSWNRGTSLSVGAVTWGGGMSGVVGVVSELNSLVGDQAGDRIGSYGVFGIDPVRFSANALANGHYVVTSPDWDHGAVANAGAVTWCDGVRGTTGVVSAGNSLVGGTENDGVGRGGLTALPTGHYVVSSPDWDNQDVVDAGAVTWGQGDSGAAGPVSSANSLVGGTRNDRVGSVTILANGNYVVRSLSWDNGAAANAGAVTFGIGSTGVSGLVSATNSLVGSNASDLAGSSVLPLVNGHYVVGCPAWDLGPMVDVGAVTWGHGMTGVVGVISSVNSLVGTQSGDRLASAGLVAVSGGDYVASSPEWDNGLATNSGAVVLGDGRRGITRSLGPTNSIRGTIPGSGLAPLSIRHDDYYRRLVVGWPGGNFVGLLKSVQLRGRLMDPRLSHRDDYQLDFGESPSGSEQAAYAGATAGFAPVLQLTDADSGAILAAETLPRDGGQTLLVFTNRASVAHELRVSSVRPEETGAYAVGLYPVVRPGQVVPGRLSDSDPFTTNRTAGVGAGRWATDDYLLLDVQGDQRLVIWVEGAEFSPFLELRLLSDESVLQYVEGTTLTNRVQSGGSAPRDYVIRVTSVMSGAFGTYRLRVEQEQTTPIIWSFTPSSGIPGTWVTVRGSNFVDGLQPLIDGVTIGGAGAALLEPVDRGGWQEVETLVPPDARTGPIALLRNQRMVATSTDDFVVLAPVGGVRAEVRGRLSFGVTNAGAGIQNVFEATDRLDEPIRWTAIVTNTISVPGGTRYTNSQEQLGTQRFYRVRVAR